MGEVNVVINGEEQSSRAESVKLLRKPYNFRYLNSEESSLFANGGSDKDQLELTRSLLFNPELRPTGVLKIDDKEFYVGKIWSTDSGRDQAVMFVKNGSGVLMPRVLYKSKSDGGWRSCPGLEDGYRYSKGLGFHYTQETKPHENIIRYLEEADKTGHRSASYSTDVIEEYFDGGKSSGWNSFDKEVALYDDKGVLREFQKYPPGYYTKEKLKNLGGEISLPTKFKELDFSNPGLKEFLPNFSQPPVKTGRTKHTLLGYINIEAFTAKLNGRPVEWVMAYDKNGRVWVDRIAFLDAKINSYGVSSEVINSGALTNKPLEYVSQVTALEKGRDYQEFDSRYADITPLLDNLLPIRQFRKARGIYRNGVDNNVNRQFTGDGREISFDEKIKALDREMDFVYEGYEAESQRRQETTKIISWKDIETAETSDEKTKRVKQIINKCHEYEKRLANISGSIPPADNYGIDAWYKREVARQLIFRGYINVGALQKAIEKVTGSIDKRTYENACFVISDYMRSGGKAVSGGTGLR